MIQLTDSPFQQPSTKRNAKNKAMQQEFNAPNNNFVHSSFQSLLELEDQLKQQNVLTYFRKKRRGMYCYYLCKFCRARIVAVVENQGVRLIRFQNFHKHDARKNKKIQEGLIIELLEESNKIQTPQQLRARILSMLPISLSRYNYILRKFIDQNCYQNAVKFLNSNGYYTKISHHEEEDLPELMLIMSPEQRKIAIKFNDSFSFDVTYNLLKDRSKDGKQWGLGVFTTFDTNLRICPVAFCLILRQNAQRFATLFRGFFELIQSRTCTLVTDDQSSIRAGLEILSSNGIYNGNHVLDSFHLLRNIRKKVSEEDFSLYHTIITTAYPAKFKKAVQLLKQRDTNSYMLQEIVDNAQRYCFSMGKPKFVGLSFSTSGTEKCNDFIKTLVPRETNIYRLILAIVKIQKRIQVKPKFQTQKYQQIFSDQRILQVRQSVESKIFMVFLRNYIKGLRCEIRLISENDRIYEVQRTRTTGRDCECLYSQRTGIPCDHMLAVLSRHSDLSYLKYFNWRWTDCIINQEIKPRKPGSRRSRRRRK